MSKIVNKIEFGDCRRIMSDWIWDGVKVQTCVTSPPYFGLRDYGVDGQMGLEEKTPMIIDRSERTHELGQTRSSGTMVSPASSKTVGWIKGCKCNAEIVSDIVFDPFMGSGTTAEVALRYGRNYLGCELNPAYKELQDKRIASVK